MKVIIYTDGSARSNPGRGGYGAVLKYTNPAGKTFTSELSRGYAKTTNNRMELMAVIVALEALNRPCDVEVHSDSQYVVNAFNKHWIDGWKKPRLEDRQQAACQEPRSVGAPAHRKEQAQSGVHLG